jgi:CubicO group peptidase (beta-lactamase class C family)
MNKVFTIFFERLSKFALIFSMIISGGFVFAEPLPSSMPEEQDISSDRLQLLKEMSQMYVDEGRVAGIVNVVVRNGKVVHYEATGGKGIEDSRPVEKNDLFRIYSMTKPITAVAAMQLYEQGKFRLSDPVHKFVPEFENLQVLNEQGILVDADRPMTMQQLLTHTTGLSYGFAAGVDMVDQLYSEADLWALENLDAFAEAIAKIPLKFHPGERWHYSVAVDVTGLVVQRISGKSFDQYMHDHIFEPLGMEDTFFAVPREKRSRFLPNHYYDAAAENLISFEQVDDDGLVGQLNRRKVAMGDYYDVSLFSGGGGLVSTAMDYARFAEMMRNGGSLDGVRILSPKTVNYMASNHLSASLNVGGIGESPTQQSSGDTGFGFGLGFGLVTDTTAGGGLGGSAVIGSVGEFNWGGAAGTVFWIDPVEELVVVSMIQLMGSPWPLRHDLKVAVYQALDKTYE